MLPVGLHLWSLFGNCDPSQLQGRILLSLREAAISRLEKNVLKPNIFEYLGGSTAVGLTNYFLKLEEKTDRSCKTLIKFISPILLLLRKTLHIY